MATVLVADDNPIDRELLLTQLGSGGHRLLQAQDGAEALELVRAERPDLVIADVLMPSMDGYEFVRRLRAAPSIAATPVIFYTAAYQQREARALAEGCGVLYVLTKPSEPEVLLRAVSAALSAPPGNVGAELPTDFDHRHLRLVSECLVRSARDLEALSQRLSALVELGLRLASEPDPQRLLQIAGHAARELIGANSAAIELVDPERHTLQQVVTSGSDPAPAESDEPSIEPATLRTPLASPAHTYGYLVLRHKPGGGAFSPDDRHLAVMLAAQLALTYENARCYQAAQDAVRSRDEFLSITAHELKTPVTTLLGYAQLLLSYFASGRQIEPERQTRALQAFEQQSLRLSRLVARLLDISSIEAGGIRLNLRMVNVAGLVQRVLARARTQADGHTFVEHAPGEILAMVDPLRLELVVSELVENALKYSPRPGQIEVEVAASGVDSVQVAVRDRGPGIPPAMRRQMFGRFYRAHAESHASGMGLGLYISRQIVELHGGHMRAEFPPEGGTRIVVDLPVFAAVPRRGAPVGGACD